MPDLPKITIAVLSWNRLHYLRAAIESARRCICYPDIEWIISDNESEEPGLRQYIDGLNWIERKFIQKQTHADAMNQIVREAKGEYLILWPEDVQFVVEGPWLADLVEIMEKNPLIGSVILDAQRRRTLESVLDFCPFGHLKLLAQELYWYRTSFRRPRLLESSNGFRVRTYGWKYSGICGSGIPSLTRTEVWRKLGPWKTKSGGVTALVDSSLGAEEDMYARFYLSKLPLQSAVSMLPVAADIITDPLGTKAKVRGSKRYGVYVPPKNGDLYYEIRRQEQMPSAGDLPLSFMEIVKPIGFSIPLDEHGDRKKYGLNENVIFDIKNNCQVS